MRGDRVINIFSLCQKGRSAMKKILLTALLFSLMVCFTSPAWAGGLDDANAGAAAFQEKNYDKAIRLFTKAIASGELTPEHLKAAHALRGLAWDGKGDYAKAIADYSKAIEINPKDAATYYNRGLAWVYKGDYDKAIADFTKAIELNPRYTAAYNNRGNIYDSKGDYDKAIVDYTKAIEIDPKDAFAYSNRGVIWGKKGDYNKAIADINTAIEIDPKYASAYSNRGVIWGKKGDYDKAIADNTKAIEISPKHADAYYNRGNDWENKGDYDKAIADWTKAIEINPKHAFAYSNRGHAWRKKGVYNKGMADFIKAIEINPKDANAYNGFAWLMATCPEGRYRDGKRAIELAEKALELKETSYILNTLGAAYAEAGRFQEAIKTQERAITKRKQEGGPEALTEFEEHLSSYKAGKPWREK
jgi:tetratricopeptide (TPR) repeat protein